MSIFPPQSQTFTWSSILKLITEGNELTEPELHWAMNAMLADGTDIAEKTAFIIAMSMKKISARELDILSRFMLENSRKFPRKFAAIDIVGTGADNSHSYNISTMATIVAAAAGARVIKHGSRSASSQSGGADMLEQLGICLEPSLEELTQGIGELGIGFCFAPYFHPMFSSVAPIRKKLGIPTFLNWLGPISNPAGVAGGLIGCASPTLIKLYAEVFACRGLTGMIIRGNDGLDELTICDSSKVFSVFDSRIYEWEFSPQEVGISLQANDALRGGNAQENARKAREVFAGKPSAVADAVILNAGAAIAIAQAIPGVFQSDDRVEINNAESKKMLIHDPVTAISCGMTIAQEAITNGSVAELVESWTQLQKNSQSG